MTAPLLRGACAAALLASSGAGATGFNFLENGAKAMMQGGAFAAQADDLTAIHLNPAGLAQQPGLGLLADGQLLQHDVTFKRQNPGFDPQNPTALPEQVQNTGGLFALPFFAASYGFPLAGRPLTVGLGLYAPPTVGRYRFPSPDMTQDAAGKYVAPPQKYAPQRYALIGADLFVAYPTLTVAFAPHPRVHVGVSGQLVLTSFAFSQVLFAGDALGIKAESIAQENPDYDVRVDMSLEGRPTATAILGVLARPTDWLQVGASFRPPVAITARGSMRVQLSPFFTEAGATVQGDTASLQLTLPMEGHLGVRVAPSARWGVNAELVYTGWDSIDALRVVPEGVSLKTGPTAEPVAVGTTDIPKQWRPSLSARLGGSVDVVRQLTVHAGALFETGAASEAYTSVDFNHPTRVFLAGGLTGHLGPVDLLAGFAWSPTVTTVVTESQVRRTQTDKTVEAGTVGTGLYTSGGWSVLFGVRARLFAPTKG